MPGTKIIILRMRELVYTGIFVGIGILLVVLLYFMFWGKNDNQGGSERADINTNYQAGVYTKELVFGESTVSLKVALDTDHVKSVEIEPLDESVTTMYPLMQPVVETISEQLAAGVTIEDIAMSEESQYTQEMILGAVEEILVENTQEDEKEVEEKK